MSSIDIYKRALELAESGQPFVLASVIVAQGSTPQKAGANAVFEPAGGIAGTLGGEEPAAGIAGAGGPRLAGGVG